MADLIGPGSWVEIHYTLRDSRGNLLESTEGPDGDGPVSFVWGLGSVGKGLEESLEGAIVGDTIDVTIPPEDGYGTRDPDDVFEVDRSDFPDPESIEVGSEFSADGDDGTSMTMRVVEIHPESVLVDANHPLAGETLNYQIKVLAVRAATSDEILVARAEMADPPSLDEAAS